MPPSFSSHHNHSLLNLLLLLFVLPYPSLAKPSPSNYKDEASKILQALTPTTGACANQAWEKLATFTDTIGNRLCGSVNLKRTVDYMLETWTTEEGFENVHGEAARVPRWERGREECVMLSPRWGYEMSILGLGTSVGTTTFDIDTHTNTFAPLIGEVTIATTFEELDALGAAGLVKGKIVLLNYQCDWKENPISCYSTSAQYRSQGASHASQHGAIAYLVRSLASASIGSPHTGYQGYTHTDTHTHTSPQKIPAAAVTIEDADAMARMATRGQNITLSLYMEAYTHPPTLSHNVIAEWTGTEKPEEVVLLSGHIDSWDVGAGAMDDGGGFAISWQALSTLKSLNLRPKRTIRVVGWTCEEFGGVGARQYYEDHKHEAEKMVCVIESDMGAFLPKGLTFTGSPAASQVMEEILQLLRPINASQLVVSEEGGGYETDTGPWRASKVPGASLLSANERYFNFHHSMGDQMGVLDKEEMDMSVCVFAVVAFVLADLDEMLGRNEEESEEGVGGGMGEEGKVTFVN